MQLVPVLPCIQWSRFYFFTEHNQFHLLNAIMGNRHLIGWASLVSYITEISLADSNAYRNASWVCYCETLLIHTSPNTLSNCMEKKPSWTISNTVNQIIIKNLRVAAGKQPEFPLFLEQQNQPHTVSVTCALNACVCVKTGGITPLLLQENIWQV